MLETKVLELNYCLLYGSICGRRELLPFFLGFFSYRIIIKCPHSKKNKINPVVPLSLNKLSKTCGSHKYFSFHLYGKNCKCTYLLIFVSLNLNPTLPASRLRAGHSMHLTRYWMSSVHSCVRIVNATSLKRIIDYSLIFLCDSLRIHFQ